MAQKMRFETDIDYNLGYTTCPNCGARVSMGDGTLFETAEEAMAAHQVFCPGDDDWSDPDRMK
jgi:hypothetical protein